MRCDAMLWQAPRPPAARRPPAAPPPSIGGGWCKISVAWQEDAQRPPPREQCTGTAGHGSSIRTGSIARPPCGGGGRHAVPHRRIVRGSGGFAPRPSHAFLIWACLALELADLLLQPPHVPVRPLRHVTTCAARCSDATQGEASASRSCRSVLGFGSFSEVTPSSSAAQRAPTPPCAAMRRVHMRREERRRRGGREAWA